MMKKEILVVHIDGNIMKKEYKDNFEFTEDIKTSLDIKVKLYVYDDARESNVNGKWQHSDPRGMWFNIEDIFYFREQTLNDKYNNDCNWIMESTVMPTKWCMMVYHDTYTNKQKIMPVVGKVKELNEALDTLKDNYYKRSRRLYRLHDKIKDVYLNEEVESKWE